LLDVQRGTTILFLYVKLCHFRARLGERQIVVNRVDPQQYRPLRKDLFIPEPGMNLDDPPRYLADRGPDPGGLDRTVASMTRTVRVGSTESTRVGGSRTWSSHTKYSDTDQDGGGTSSLCQ
jgi:hypothetical protein